MAVLIASRDEQFRSFAFALTFPEFTTTNTASGGQVAATVSMFLPDHAANDELKAFVDVKGPPSGTGSWALRIGATTGTFVNFASPGAYILSDMALVALPAASADGYVDVVILVRSNSGGAVYIKNEAPHLTFWFDSP